MPTCISRRARDYTQLESRRSDDSGNVPEIIRARNQDIREPRPEYIQPVSERPRDISAARRKTMRKIIDKKWSKFLFVFFSRLYNHFKRVIRM